MAERKREYISLLDALKTGRLQDLLTLEYGQPELKKPVDTAPHWYFTQTLMHSSSGDTNRRILHHDDKSVAVFNRGMEVWRACDTEALNKLCEYLNEIYLCRR
jgi:hypothetical protein